jgi:hypothetical protein
MLVREWRSRLAVASRRLLKQCDTRKLIETALSLGHGGYFCLYRTPPYMCGNVSGRGNTMGFCSNRCAGAMGGPPELLAGLASVMDQHRERYRA